VEILRTILTLFEEAELEHRGWIKPNVIRLKTGEDDRALTKRISLLRPINILRIPLSEFFSSLWF
jgi:hypothetical protein